MNRKQLHSRYCQTGLPYTKLSRGWFADIASFLRLLLLCHTYKTTRCLEPAPLFNRTLRTQQRAALVWKLFFLRALGIKLTALAYLANTLVLKHCKQPPEDSFAWGEFDQSSESLQSFCYHENYLDLEIIRLSSDFICLTVMFYSIIKT